MADHTDDKPSTATAAKDTKPAQPPANPNQPVAAIITQAAAPVCTDDGVVYPDGTPYEGDVTHPLTPLG